MKEAIGEMRKTYSRSQRERRRKTLTERGVYQFYDASAPKNLSATFIRVSKTLISNALRNAQEKQCIFEINI